MEDSIFVNNYRFGNKWETECVFMIREYHGYAIHVWSRYIADIISNPPSNVDISRGLSRDWTKRMGPYDSNSFYEIDVLEYLDDLKQYVLSPRFSFEETDEVLGLIISFLEYAKNCNFHVIVRDK